jgi:uroporphyrinogen decarboxylase
MPKYTHRQRVLRTLTHQEADRIPMDMMGHATMLLDNTYIRLRDHLGLTPIPPARSGSTANYYDERILERFDIDFRRVWLKSHPQARPVLLEDGSFVDAWGIRSKTDGQFVNVVEFPLKGVSTVEEIETYPWPQAEALFTTENLAQDTRHRFEQTDYALVARNPLTFGLFDRACAMMGNAEFMTAMGINPPLAHALLSHLLEIYKDVWGLFLDAVGPYVQMVEYGDDLGAQNNLLISPAMYQAFLKPREADLFALIHRKAPGAAIFRHCDGSILKIIPDFIEVGVNVLNPVQTSARGMNGRVLKENFGQSLTFHGAIEHMEDAREILLAEIKERIDTFSKGGGYIFASCNHMIDVPPENIILMFETARELGKYDSL